MRSSLVWFSFWEKNFCYSQNMCMVCVRSFRGSISAALPNLVFIPREIKVTQVRNAGKRDSNHLSTAIMFSFSTC